MMSGQQRAAALEDYLLNIPDLHSWDDGKTWNSGGFGPSELRSIYEIVQGSPEPARVLETGAGNSTICFLLAGCGEVTSIAPDQPLFDRIKKYCTLYSIDTSPLNSIVAISEDSLPYLAADYKRTARAIDFALLDGGHGWPTVFVDFCYTYALLRQGGWLMIDDIQLYSVKELARFLVKSWQFDLVAKLPKSLIFRKNTDERVMGDFGGQPYIIQRTREDADNQRAFEL